MTASIQRYYEYLPTYVVARVGNFVNLIPRFTRNKSAKCDCVAQLYRCLGKGELDV